MNGRLVVWIGFGGMLFATTCLSLADRYESHDSGGSSVDKRIVDKIPDNEGGEKMEDSLFNGYFLDGDKTLDGDLGKEIDEEIDGDDETKEEDSDSYSYSDNLSHSGSYSDNLKVRSPFMPRSRGEPFDEDVDYSQPSSPHSYQCVVAIHNADGDVFELRDGNDSNHSFWLHSNPQRNEPSVPLTFVSYDRDNRILQAKDCNGQIVTIYQAQTSFRGSSGGGGVSSQSNVEDYEDVSDLGDLLQLLGLEGDNAIGMDRGEAGL
jgi:hypothetical protein